MTNPLAPLEASSQGPATSRTLWAAAAVVVVFGVVLRLMGFFDLQLWLDEASWCKRLVDGHYGWIRPVGYMWITRQLVLFHNTEPMLRSLSYVAGIAQLPLLYLLVRRVVAVPAIAVGATFALAIHPIAVAMTKEFKPYALESCLHVLLLLLAFGYATTQRRGLLAATLGLAIVGPLFAWTLVFAYPGVFSVIGLAVLFKRRRDVGVVVVGIVLIFAVLIAIFVARVSKEKRDTDFWGQKYDVFYIADGGLFDRVAWAAKKSFDIATFPADLHWPWPGREALAVVVALFVGVGCTAIVVRRQWTIVALFLSPWLVTLAFNQLGQWPYGLFRTNVFLLSYTIALAALGVDALLAPLFKRRSAAAVVVFAAIAIAFPHDLAAFGQKRAGTLTAEASVRTALEKIRDVERGEGKKAERPLVVMDGHACGISNYYRDYNANSRAELHGFFKHDVQRTCSHVSPASWMKTLQRVKGKSFWLVAAKRGAAAVTRAELAPWCTVLHDELLPETTLLYRCQASQTPPAPNVPAPTPDGAGEGEGEAIDDDTGEP